MGKREVRAFVKTALGSAAILAVASILLTGVLVGIQEGDWDFAFAEGGWFASIVGRLYFDPWWFIWPPLLLLAYFVADRVLRAFARGYQASIVKQRQGLAGEMIRMPPGVLLVTIPVTNFFEEVLFRGALLALVQQIALPLGEVPAGVLALAVSSILFWLAHENYRGLSSTVLTLLLAAVLGVAYLVSGSILTCFIAHIVYNVVVLVQEHVQSLRDPGYFGGKPPTHVLTGNSQPPEQ